MDNNVTIDNFTWTAFRNGDKEAYAVIYREYFRRLYNYGMRFTQDITLVEDCIQELLLGLWLKRKQMDNVVFTDSYLFVSFRNNLFYLLKKRLASNIINIEDSYNFELQVSIDQVMIDSERLYEQQINLREAVMMLTERQKEAVYLKFYENLSYEQIASVLNLSTKGVYKLIARSITGLRAVYKKSSLIVFPGIVVFDALHQLFPF